MRKLQWVTVGVAVVALAVALAASVAVLQTPMEWPPTATFRLLDRPPQLEDLEATKGRRDDVKTDLSRARLLGTDDRGNKYLLAPSADTLCLVVLTSPSSSGSACDSTANLAKSGLWLEFGDEWTSRIAMAVPDEYVDATVSTTGRRIAVRSGNLIVVEARGPRTDSVTLKSPKYKSLTVGHQ